MGIKGNKQTILGTGLSGLIGTYLIDSLSPIYDFENLSLETGVDITNASSVYDFISKSKAEWVFHFAAKTNVDEAEQEKSLGQDSPTWKINVGATQTLVEACKKYNKKLLYLSTDFVFPGGDQIFSETDTPKPLGWYAQTKFEGEKSVQSLKDQGLIVRISYPYGSVDGPRPDFVGRILQLLKDGKEIQSPTDQIFVPTYLDDIVSSLSLLIERNASGIYHVVGPKGISSYDASCLIADTFGLSKSLVVPTTAAAFYKDRAQRAFHLVISNGRISELGVKPLDFKSGLTKVKQKIK